MAVDDAPQIDPSILSSIQNAAPKWLQDGFGVRGNPVVRNNGGSAGGAGFSPSPWSGVQSPTSDPQQTDFSVSSSLPLTDIPTLPSTIGNGGASTFPFELYLDDKRHVAVNYGEVDGVPPSGMAAGNPYVLQNADGDIFLHLTFNGATRELTSSFITWGVDATNTETDKYIAIGSVSRTTDSSGNITYSIDEQYLATSVYTDQALYVSDNENRFYADENGVFVGDNSYRTDLDSSSLNIRDASETGSGISLDLQGDSADGTGGKIVVYGANGSYAALYQTGGLQLHDGDTGNDLALYPYELELKDSNGFIGTYEAKQLTLSNPTGDQSYLSTAALVLGTQQGNGTYEPQQLTLRDQTGGVDANTTEIKTYNANGSYAAIGSAGTLDLRNAQSQHLYLDPTELQLTDSNGFIGTYEAKQLTLSNPTGDQSYLSTAALVLGTQQGNGTYEPQQLTLRDQTGGVDANTTQIKTYTAEGSYAAIGSAGTLDLRNDQSQQLSLDPTQIEFTGSNQQYSTMDADGFVTEDSTTSTAISPGEINVGISSRGSEAAVDITTDAGTGLVTCYDNLGNIGRYSALVAELNAGTSGFSKLDYQGLTVSDEQGTVYSAISNTFLEITNTSTGAGATLSGNGELDLTNAVGQEFHLTPDYIQFDNTAVEEHGYLGSDKVTIWDSSTSSVLDSNSLVITDAQGSWGGFYATGWEFNDQGGTSKGKLEVDGTNVNFRLDQGSDYILANPGLGQIINYYGGKQTVITQTEITTDTYTVNNGVSIDKTCQWTTVTICNDDGTQSTLQVLAKIS